MSKYLFHHFDFDTSTLTLFDMESGNVQFLQMTPSGVFESANPAPEKKQKQERKPKERKYNHNKKPKTQDEIDAFLATVAEQSYQQTAEQYGVSIGSVHGWKSEFRKKKNNRSVNEQMSGPEIAHSGGNNPVVFKCAVECGQKNWQTRQALGEARCPKCLTKAIIA